MAFGDSPDDTSLRDAWYAFCDRLRAAGDQVFKDYNPATPLQRADGFRFLTQNLGQAFDLGFETKNTRYPQLFTFSHPTCKLGGDCSDFIYIQAWIDGESAYKISGNRGTCRFLNFTVQGPRPAAIPNGNPPLHDPFGDVPEVTLFGHQLVTDWDGGFELYIGGEKQGANWLPTTPGSRKLFLRQGFDRFDERPATMRIERIDMTEPKPMPLPADMIAGMDWAGTFLSNMMDEWPDWSFRNGGVSAANPNAFPKMEDAPDAASDKKRGRAVVNMYWEIAEDEALILEFDQHQGLWMLTNMGAFMTSMDYLYRPISFTPSRSTIDGDGKVRLILAHDDCGYHNWMDTQGFVRGHVTYRHMLEGGPVPIATRLVKRAELDAALPADSARVTPEQRTAQLWARFNGIRQRYLL